MEHYGKNKNPYKGIAIPIIIAIGLPIGMYFFFYPFLNVKNNTPTMAMYMSLSFAGLVGVLFDLICFFHGLLSDLIQGLFLRIKETISFFGFFKKGAMSYYFSCFMHDGGPILWIFVLIFGATIAMMTFGLVNFLGNLPK